MNNQNCNLLQNRIYPPPLPVQYEGLLSEAPDKREMSELPKQLKQSNSAMVPRKRAFEEISQPENKKRNSSSYEYLLYKRSLQPLQANYQKKRAEKSSSRSSLFQQKRSSLPSINGLLSPTSLTGQIIRKNIPVCEQQLLEMEAHQRITYLDSRFWEQRAPQLDKIVLIRESLKRLSELMKNPEFEKYIWKLVCPRCFKPVSKKNKKKYKKSKKDYVLTHLLLYHWRELPSLLDDGKIKIFKPCKYQREIVSFKQLFRQFKPVTYVKALSMQDNLRPFTFFISPMLQLFSKSQKLPVYDIERSGMLQVRDLREHNLQELNLLDFLLIESIVGSLQLSEASLNQWGKPSGSLIRQHVKRVNLPLELCRTTKQGDKIYEFEVHDFFKKYLSCFFTWHLEDSGSGQKEKSQFEQPQLEQLHNYLYKHISDAIQKIKALNATVNKASPDWNKLQHLRHLVQLFESHFPINNDQFSINRIVEQIMFPCLQIYSAIENQQRLSADFNFLDQKEKLKLKLECLSELQLQLIIEEQELLNTLILRQFGELSADEYLLVQLDFLFEYMNYQQGCVYKPQIANNSHLKSQELQEICKIILNERYYKRIIDQNSDYQLEAEKGGGNTNNKQFTHGNFVQNQKKNTQKGRAQTDANTTQKGAGKNQNLQIITKSKVELIKETMQHLIQIDQDCILVDFENVHDEFAVKLDYPVSSFYFQSSWWTVMTERLYLKQKFNTTEELDIVYQSGKLTKQNIDKTSYVVSLFKFQGKEYKDSCVCLASAIYLNPSCKSGQLGQYFVARENKAFERHINSALLLISGLPGIVVAAHGIKSAFNEQKTKEAFLKNFIHIEQQLSVQHQTFGFAMTGSQVKRDDFFVPQLPDHLQVCYNKARYPWHGQKMKKIFFIKALLEDFTDQYPEVQHEEFVLKNQDGALPELKKKQVQSLNDSISELHSLFCSKNQQVSPQIEQSILEIINVDIPQKITQQIIEQQPNLFIQQNPNGGTIQTGVNPASLKPSNIQQNQATGTLQSQINSSDPIQSERNQQNKELHEYKRGVADHFGMDHELTIAGTEFFATEKIECLSRVIQIAELEQAYPPEKCQRLIDKCQNKEKPAYVIKVAYLIRDEKYTDLKVKHGMRLIELQRKQENEAVRDASQNQQIANQQEVQHQDEPQIEEQNQKMTSEQEDQHLKNNQNQSNDENDSEDPEFEQDENKVSSKADSVSSSQVQARELSNQEKLQEIQNLQIQLDQLKQELQQKKQETNEEQQILVHFQADQEAWPAKWRAEKKSAEQQKAQQQAQAQNIINTQQQSLDNLVQQYEDECVECKLKKSSLSSCQNNVAGCFATYCYECSLSIIFPYIQKQQLQLENLDYKCPECNQFWSFQNSNKLFKNMMKKAKDRTLSFVNDYHAQIHELNKKIQTQKAKVSALSVEVKGIESNISSIEEALKSLKQNTEEYAQELKQKAKSEAQQQEQKFKNVYSSSETDSSNSDYYVAGDQKFCYDDTNKAIQFPTLNYMLYPIQKIAFIQTQANTAKRFKFDDLDETSPNFQKNLEDFIELFNEDQKNRAEPKPLECFSFVHEKMILIRNTEDLKYCLSYFFKNPLKSLNFMKDLHEKKIALSAQKNQQMQIQEEQKD